MRTVIAATLGAVVTLWCGAVWPQALVPRVGAAETDLPPLECAKHAVTVEIDDQIARVHIEQLFVNSTGNDLEAVYFLPLHESASVSRFSYWVKGKEITGKIREKEEARKLYEKIVAAKRDPGLLEYAGRNLFRANIFPVSPAEPMRVVVEYTQICAYDSGKARFSFPLTAGGKEQQVKQFAITVNIRDQQTIERITCPATPGAAVSLKDPHSGTVSFEQSRFTPEKDFEVTWELKSREFDASLLTFRPGGQDGYFMLMVAPQAQVAETEIVKKDMVLVFDTSGSMQGEKIEQARAALVFCLSNLGHDDRFNLVTFSNDVQRFSEGLMPASQENVRRALERVKGLNARGGTSINDALVTAMDMFEPNTNQKTIIFLTDGLPTVGEQDIGKIVANVRGANHRKIRLFTFGVGDDVDDYLLLKLATDNHGIEQHVRAGQSIQAKVSEFYAKIAKPVLVDVALDFGKVTTNRTYPETLPDIFKGRQLIVAGRYFGEGEHTITLTGEVNGVPRRYEFAANFPAASDDNAFIARIWAKARVDWALDEIRLKGENPELKAEIIALSKEYVFVTPYTSMLALPKDEEDALASTSAPAYPVGGDPIIRVLAPPDTRRVLAVFPWGETMPLVLDRKSGYWQCRFIVPKSAGHGDYDVVIVITRGDGMRQRLVVSFQADREAPGGDGMGRATRTGDGWQVRLSVQATDDTHRAEAVLPSGERLAMGLNSDSGRWEGAFMLDGTHTGSVMVPIILFDRGHNRLVIEVEVELN